MAIPFASLRHNKATLTMLQSAAKSCIKSCEKLGVLTAVGLNVDDIPRQHLLLLQAVIDGGVQLQLLGALHAFQTNDDMCDDFAVAACLQCVCAGCISILLDSTIDVTLSPAYTHQKIQQR